ncbi:MAG: class I SAM-dependent rRNA methyltransferase [Candidatus Riflebacteria bacterium]|nr:class I SAM-dependent rRNA methyltransferase [Candidatus Riflebacteria bacterium]
MSSQRLYLKKNKEFSLIKGHPWAYAEAFREVPERLATGDLVEVRSHRDQVMGYGYADVDSKILVRMLPLAPGEPLTAGIGRLVREAVVMRRERFASPETTAYRLVNGEGDAIPGLIIDRYERAVSLQIYSLGLTAALSEITRAIKELLPEIKWIWRRNQIRLARADAAGLILGSNLPDKIEFKEYGLKFSTDLVNGQKTGFFLDQRENRNLIRSIAAGRNFLNVCGYTGAFTVAAAAGGAAQSVTVDIAKPALAEAENNLRLNSLALSAHKLVAADMYEYLTQCRPGSFDLVVLDPPSMAKNRRDAEKALRAYRRLNQLGTKVVSSGGYMFTASCTSQVGREEFIEAVRDAVASAGRRAMIVHESFHAVDHPIALAHPEGRYLKGLLLKIY